LFVAIAPILISAVDMKQRTSCEPRKASTYFFTEECQLKDVGGDVGIDNDLVHSGEALWPAAPRRGAPE
jgi:hypothetical protein